MRNKDSRLYFKVCAVVVTAVFWAGYFAAPAGAFQFQKGEVTGFIDTTVSVGANLRVQERDHSLIGTANGGTAPSVNGDDGNMNFSKGKVTSFAAKATHDIGASYQNLSTFIRVSYFFDPINRYKKELTPNMREKAGQGIDILDAYIRGEFEPGGKKLDVRAGRQVLNWGESLFIPGGLSVINAVEVSKLRLPGAEVREAFLPSTMISDSYQVTERLNMQNYYIFEYNRNEGDVCGTFFSTDDTTCEGSSGDITTGFGALDETTPGKQLHRLPDHKPDSQGQFGTAFHYLSPELNNTEFGFYFLNYHTKTGVGSAVSSTPGANPSYFVENFENLQSYAVSLNTDMPWGIALQSEYSYRPNVPLQVETNEVLAAAQYFPGAQRRAVTGPNQVVKGYEQMPVNQLQATLSKSFARQNPFGADDWSIVGEAATIYISHFPNQSDLRFDGPGTNLPAYGGLGAPGIETSGWGEHHSWGYVIATSATYNQVVKNVSLIPRVAFSHNVQGTTPQPVSTFLADRMSVSAGVTARYLESWSVDLNYTNFFGAGSRNALNDRDFLGMTVKHWF